MNPGSLSALCHHHWVLVLRVGRRSDCDLIGWFSCVLSWQEQMSVVRQTLTELLFSFCFRGSDDQSPLK